jgi:hypothetical protein
MKILIQHNFCTGLGEFIRNITHYMFLLKPYKNNGYEIHLLINLRENKYVNKPFFERLFSKDICDYFNSITETPIPIHSNEYNGFKYFMSAHEPQKPGVHQWDIFFDNIEGFDFEIPKIYSGTLIRDNLKLDTLPTFSKEITSRVNNFIENNSINFNYLHIRTSDILDDDNNRYDEIIGKIHKILDSHNNKFYLATNNKYIYDNLKNNSKILTYHFNMIELISNDMNGFILNNEDFNEENGDILIERLFNITTEMVLSSLSNSIYYYTDSFLMSEFLFYPICYSNNSIELIKIE